MAKPWSAGDQLLAADLNSAIKFGGDGSDGALSISSGTTTIDLGSAAVVTKNYTSISITGTGKLAFSNPHANGTIIILKSQGNVTITSSTSPAIDASGMGAAAGTDGNTTMYGYSNKGVAGGTNTAGSLVGGTGGAAKAYLNNIAGKVYKVSCGGGGGNGGDAGAGSGGAGGRGGAALIIECGGAYNRTSNITVAGANGSNGVGSGSTGGSGGGGTGAGGTFLAIYNTLTANSGTTTVTGGATAGTGGNGLGTSDVGCGGGGGANITAGTNGGAGSRGAGDGGDGGIGGDGQALTVANGDF